MGYDSAYLFIVFFLDKFDLYGDHLPQNNPSTELKLWMVTVALRMVTVALWMVTVVLSCSN